VWVIELERFEYGVVADQQTGYEEQMFNRLFTIFCVSIS